VLIDKDVLLATIGCLGESLFKMIFRINTHVSEGPKLEFENKAIFFIRNFYVIKYIYIFQVNIFMERIQHDI